MPVINPMVFYWMSVTESLKDFLLFAGIGLTETIEKMVIAQNVTYERVEQATDVVADVYDDIMDLFRQDDQKK